jgi:hypothetical protein
MMIYDTIYVTTEPREQIVVEVAQRTPSPYD